MTMTSAFLPSLVGLEEELALAVPASARGIVQSLASALVLDIPNQTACVQSADGAVNNAGFFLQNGSKIYHEAGNFVEVCSAEVTDPLQAVAYLRAGERLLLAGLGKASASVGLTPDQISLLRASTDYQSHYHGTHLNILTRNVKSAELVNAMVPFLSTRYFAAAGGWGPTGFTSTQKNRAIQSPASLDTRNARGIVNLKEESLSAQNRTNRFHLAHGDSCQTDMCTFLSLATTALVVRMLDEGAVVGPALKLQDPIDALRVIDSDPDWRRPLKLACGLEMSPVDIQSHYLTAAKNYVSKTRVPWMERTVVFWRDTLEKVREDPESLSDCMDLYAKRSLYRRILEKKGIPWNLFDLWCGALWPLQEHLREWRPRKRYPRDHFRDRLSSVSFDLLEDRMRRAKLPWADVPRMSQTLQEMLAIDLKFHDIGPSSLFWQLSKGRLINSRLVSDSEIARAMTEPPTGTRAQARGPRIRDVSNDLTARANWFNITSTQGILDLGDPFQVSGTWMPLPGRKK
jgi:hypothetical protein